MQIDRYIHVYIKIYILHPFKDNPDKKIKARRLKVMPGMMIHLKKRRLPLAKSVAAIALPRRG